MSMILSNSNFMRCDPDRRQNRGNGLCKTRKMTEEERAKYGPVNTELKRIGNFKISVAEVERVCKRRRVKEV